MDSRKKGQTVLIFSALLTVIAAVLAIVLGASTVSPKELLGALAGDTGSVAYRILMFIRLPRVCAALLAGSALAVSGVLLQAVLHNSLASPHIIGVNNGAGLMVLLCAAAFPAAYSMLPLAAFAGALLTALLVFALSMGNRASKITLVLTGMAVSSIFGAGMNTILIVAPDIYTGASAFLVGGLAGITGRELIFPAVYIAVGLIFAFCLSRQMNVLALGDDAAHSLGMQVPKIRFLAVLASALLTGAAISFAGLLGFVGLIIPHAVRFLIGSDHRYLLPTSAFVGAAFVTLCDLAARTLFSPYELPVGILMSFIGGPFFIILVLRARRNAHA